MNNNDIYTSFAVLCENIEGDPGLEGKMSLLNILRAIVLRKFGPSGNDSRPAPVLPSKDILYAVCFHCLQNVISAKPEIWQVFPSGRRAKIREFPLQLPGNHSWHFETTPITFTSVEQGVHFFEVIINGTRVARTPFKVYFILERIPLLESNDFRNMDSRKTAMKPTGGAHEKCYARALGASCGKTISGEHYVSDGVLKILNASGSLLVSGLPRQQAGQVKELPISALTTNNLCDRHNSALSNLDTTAIKFFDCIHRIFNESAKGIANTDEIFLFSGDDIERWMLKILCGITSAGIVSTESGVVRGWQPPLEWLQILFGERPWPSGWGMYFLLGEGDLFTTSAHVSFAALSSKENDIYGLLLSLDSLRFILALATPGENWSGTLLEQASYRPRQIRVASGSVERVVDFGRIAGNSVLIDYKGSVEPQGSAEV